MPWYAPRKVRIWVDVAIAGIASSCFRYESSSTIRDATVSGSGGDEADALAIDKTFGGSFGSLSCENIELSAIWLERKCE